MIILKAQHFWGYLSIKIKFQIKKRDNYKSNQLLEFPAHQINRPKYRVDFRQPFFVVVGNDDDPVFFDRDFWSDRRQVRDDGEEDGGDAKCDAEFVRERVGAVKNKVEEEKNAANWNRVKVIRKYYASLIEWRQKCSKMKSFFLNIFFQIEKQTFRSKILDNEKQEFFL